MIIIHNALNNRQVQVRFGVREGLHFTFFPQSAKEEEKQRKAAAAEERKRQKAAAAAEEGRKSSRGSLPS